MTKINIVKDVCLYTLFGLLLLLGSCQGGGSGSMEAGIASSDGMKGSSELQSEQAAPQRKLIKRGRLHFETRDLNATEQRIKTLVEEVGGYVSSEESNNYNRRQERRLELRIPAEKFDAAVEQILKGARKIDRRNITLQDVTEEYIDVSTRLENKKALEARYRELLRQATEVEELLQVEKQLAEVRSEIESMEGRLKYLNDQIALSTLNVTFYVQSGPAFTSRVFRALGNGWDILLDFLVGLVTLWPFVLIVVLLIWWIIRRRRRK